MPEPVPVSVPALVREHVVPTRNREEKSLQAQRILGIFSIGITISITRAPRARVAGFLLCVHTRRARFCVSHHVTTHALGSPTGVWRFALAFFPTLDVTGVVRKRKRGSAFARSIPAHPQQLPPPPAPPPPPLDPILAAPRPAAHQLLPSSRAQLLQPPRPAPPAGRREY